MSKNENKNINSFEKIFNNKQNLLEFYKELNPEVKNTSEEDIQILNNETNISNFGINKITFSVNPLTIVIIVTFPEISANSTLLCLGYISEVYSSYLKKHENELNSESTVQVPFIQLYQINESRNQDEINSDSYLDEKYDGNSIMKFSINTINHNNAIGIAKEYLNDLKS